MITPSDICVPARKDGAIASDDTDCISIRSANNVRTTRPRMRAYPPTVTALL